MTERVGALMDSYLDLGRPLGANRVLWEVDAPTDVRELRARSNLDSGYLSRLLRTLESEGLVRVQRRRAPTGGGARVQSHRRRPRAERVRLGERSDALARSLPGPAERAPARRSSSTRWPPSSGC